MKLMKLDMTAQTTIFTTNMTNKANIDSSIKYVHQYPTDTDDNRQY